MRPIRAWSIRLAGLIRRRRRKQDLAAEMESHLQLHIDDNLRAGLTPIEARRRALIKLGGVAPVMEACRDRNSIPLIETFFQDLRYAVRQLVKARVLRCS